MQNGKESRQCGRFVRSGDCQPRPTISLQGVEVREASYDDIGGMKKVFTGAQNVAFNSMWLFGEGRRRQAANVIQAAKGVGFKRICYTSFVGAGLGMTAEKEDDILFLLRDHAFI